MSYNIPKICLNMIVKNESAIITRLLDSVISLIDHYVICDTGSTDNTTQLIDDYFKDKNINGKIIYNPFENFGKTRSYSLAQCLHEPNSDFVLLLDADMIFEMNISNIDKFKQSLTYDAYYILQGDQHIQYKNIRLIRNKLQFYYLGVTHEYITSSHNYTKSIISKEKMYIKDIGDGGCKTDKYERDIKLLTQGLITEPNNNRYRFYLANSYKDKGDYENAIIHYKKNLELLGWDQEIWCSYYNIGVCYKYLNKYANAIEYWLEGFQYMPNRIETLFEIITYYRQMKKYRLAFHFYKIAFEYKNKIREPEEELFYLKDIYEYKLDYELILIAYYLNIDKNSINDYCLSILNLPNAEVCIKENILTNFKFYYFDLSSFKIGNIFDIDCFKYIGNDLQSKHVYEFHASTPSLCFHNGELIVIIRYVNYYIDENGHYRAKDENGNYCELQNIITRNVCAIFDYKDNKVIFKKEFEIEYNNIFDSYYKGTEDIRIMSYNNELYFTGNKITNHNDFNIFIEYGRINLQEEKLESCLLNIENKNKIEKNWVMFSNDENKFAIYNWFPLTVCKLNDEPIHSNNLEINDVEILHKIDTPHCFKYVRGSTNGIKIGNEIWFICHMVGYENSRYYYHLFVVLDANTFEIIKYSKIFNFGKHRVEYTLGFEYILEHNSFFIGYSRMDNNPGFYFINKDTIENMIYDETTINLSKND
tara:strand:- start:6922 stop:9036 length:2115 start_codon:yes stop_codon:yes gene_type:complete